MSTTKKKFSLEKLKKTDQLVIRTGREKNIDRVLFPNPVEVGLDSAGLRSALTTHGGVKLPAGKPLDTQNVLYNDNGVLKYNGKEVIISESGTASLTKIKVSDGIVVDDNGKDIVQAGTNVTIQKESDGSYTINAAGSGGSGAPTDAQYLALSANAGLSHERVFTAGTGISVNDGGAGGAYTVSVDTASIPQLGATNTFTEDITISASKRIKGSIQKLSDGSTDYIQAGSNMTVSNNGDGSITLSADNTDTTYSASSGLSLTGQSFTVSLQPGGGLRFVSSKLAVNTSEIAGTGLLATSGNTTLSVDPSAFAGSGLEESGGNLRIATSAAGNGLSGGGNSALIVEPDSTTGGNVAAVNVSANGVGLDVSSIAGSGVSADGSGNLKLDINSIGTSLSTPADSDLVAISDSGTTKKVALSDLKTYVTEGSSAYNAGDGLDLSGAAFSQRAVLSVSVDSGHFKIDGKTRPIITMPKTLNYFFDLSHSTLSGHTFALSTTFNGTHGGGSVFTNGVTTSEASPGNAGAYLEVKFTQEDPDVLYYFGNSGNMGNKIVTSISYLETDTASVTIPGQITFGQPILGSIQKLQNGSTDYIQGGSNITVTNNVDGSITIDSDVAGALTAGDGIDIVGGTISTDLKTGGGLKITDTELEVDDAVVAMLAGATFGGSITVPGAGGIKGSIQKLSDNQTDFIQAGDNVTVTNNANGSITIASTAGGGGGGGSGTIGEAEDEGGYADGLFTDFSASTSVGTAVDRFNEVLKALAPDPAPNLSTISVITSGVSAKLSFGTSNPLGDYEVVGNSAGLGSSLDTNGLYQPASSSGNSRIGVVTSGTSITGVVASNVTANSFEGGVVNYPAESIGNGDQGVLQLWVNGSMVKALTLSDDSLGSGPPGSGTASDLTDGSGFTNISSTAFGKFSNGSSFEVFRHRTARFQISATHQRNGWNYVRVKHVVGSSEYVTNFVEWVVDETKDGGGTAEPVSASGEALASLNMTGTRHLSGVEYNTGGTATYNVTVSNAYKDVYSNGNITFSGTSCTASSQSFPNVGGSENSSKSLSLTATATINDTKMLNEAMTLSVNVPHPIRANLSGAGSASIAGILLYNVNENSTVLVENFNGETYRLPAGVYSNQSDISGATWNSEINIVTGGAPGHTGGLLVYNDKLVSPTNGLNGGDFRKTSEGGNILNGPAGNVNYSSTSGTKQYYRRFTNNSGGSKTNFNLSMNMTGTTVVLSDGTINNANISIAVKLPQNTDGFSTAWLDIKKPFATGQVDSDGDGCLVGDFNSSNNSTNECTFGTQSVGNGEYIILRVTANANWSGSINQISVSWL